MLVYVLFLGSYPFNSKRNSSEMFPFVMDIWCLADVPSPMKSLTVLFAAGTV